MASLNLSPISTIVENYMIDSVTVTRYVKSLNTTTLVMTDTGTEIYSGKAMISPEGSPTASTLGGANVARAQFEISIPKSASTVLPNDKIVCDSSTYNEDMVGAEFIVIGQVQSTYLTHRRLSCFRAEVTL